MHDSKKNVSKNRFWYFPSVCLPSRDIFMKCILFQMKYYPPRPIASSLPSHDASSVLKETDYGTFHEDLILKVKRFLIEVTLELLLSVNSFLSTFLGITRLFSFKMLPLSPHGINRLCSCFNSKYFIQ